MLVRYASMPRSVWSPMWACGALVIAARTAAAAPDETATDTLYAEARAAFDKADYDRACPLFLQYYELSPVPAALFTLAECEARWGKPARALEHFEAYVATNATAPPSAVQQQRARIAYEQIAKLSALVGKVTPVVAATGPRAVAVKLDGQPVTMPVVRALVVEPGEHVLEWTPEDGAPSTKRFVVAAGESRRIELGGASEDAGSSPWGGGRSLGAPVLVAGGVAAAGLVVGGIFGGLAWSARSDIRARCPDRECDAEGLRDVERGQAFAAASTVGFAVCLVGAVATVALYLAQPSARPPVSFDATGLRGRF